MARDQVTLVNEVIAILGRGNPLVTLDENRWDAKRILDLIDKNNREQASKYAWTNLALTSRLHPATETGEAFEAKYGIMDASDTFGTYYPYPRPGDDRYPDNGEFTRLLTIYDDTGQSIYKVTDAFGSELQQKNIYKESNGIWFSGNLASENANTNALRMKYIAGVPDVYTNDHFGRQYTDIYISGIVYLAAAEFTLSDSGDLREMDFYRKTGMSYIMEAVGIDAKGRQKAPDARRAYRGDARSRTRGGFGGYAGLFGR